MTVEEDLASQILVVDDRPDELRAVLLEFDPPLDPLHPNDLTVADLEGRTLVLVDFQLQDWKGADSADACVPRDGLALAAAIRSHLRGRPAAVALHAAKLEHLAGGRSAEAREHVVARAHNLEWAFTKSAGLRDQWEILAAAVARLPGVWTWEDDDEIRRFEALLALPEADWVHAARSDLEECRPPLHEVSEYTSGMALLRWLLHRVLPYPTFLRSAEYVAVALGVDPASFRAAVSASEERNRLVERIEAARYKGILAGFLGDRWWKAGIEALVWDLTRGRPFDRDALWSAQSELAPDLRRLSEVDPVLELDERFVLTERILEREETVELQPDDWPLYAEAPAMGIARVQKHLERLLPVVVELDRERVPALDEE